MLARARSRAVPLLVVTLAAFTIGAMGAGCSRTPASPSGGRATNARTIELTESVTARAAPATSTAADDSVLDAAMDEDHGDDLERNESGALQVASENLARHHSSDAAVVGGGGGDSGERATLFEREALPKSADDVVDYTKVGERLLAEKKGMEAVGALRIALSTDPSVWQELGQAYLMAGDDDRGVACLEEAVAQDPQNTDARALLVKRYLAADDGALARVYAEELVRQEPLDVDARSLLGRALMQQKMWKEAIGAYLLVVKSEPDDIFAHNNIGYSALQIGALEIAREHLERCLSLEPQQGYMLNNLGVVYERLERRAEAHAAFSRAAELSPRSSIAKLNRDRIQAKLSHDERITSAETLLRLREPSAFVVDTDNNDSEGDDDNATAPKVGADDADLDIPAPLDAVHAAVAAATGMTGASLAPVGGAVAPAVAGVAEVAVTDAAVDVTAGGTGGNARLAPAPEAAPE